MLTPKQIEANGRTYAEQAFKILDRERTVVRNNAEWLSKLTFEELIKIASNFTVGQFLQRDNFAKRRERGDPIYVHEFFYAFMQAYDAVALQTDAQVGATEQLFNLMAGRTLQRANGQRPQVAICMPILVGTDGRLRMSKTRGNYIALNDPPEEMYGKVMSLPDEVMMDYFTLVTDVPEEEIEEMRRKLAERSVNPMDVKKRLARTIASEIHGPEAALKAEESFERTFQRKDGAVNAVTATGSAEALAPTVTATQVKHLGLLQTLVAAQVVSSKSEGRRLLRDGAIDIDEKPITSFDVAVPAGSVIRVGKHRFLRIVDSDKGD